MLKKSDITKIVKQMGLTSERDVYHFTDDEINRLTEAFLNYYKERPNYLRARYLLVFLALRFTGARISEVLQIDEKRGIDFDNSALILKTLKKSKKRDSFRIVYVPDKFISEYLRLIKKHPEIEGSAFRLKRNNFYNVFNKLCEKAKIPEKLRHPHTLRHTRAIELLRNGIPITAVQQFLGHSNVVITAAYLRYSNIEIRHMLKEKGLI